MENLKQSFEQLKITILSSNPNPWYSMMVNALNTFELEMNRCLSTTSVPEITLDENDVVVEKPKKTAKKATIEEQNN
jgi:hypothetical protein